MEQPIIRYFDCKLIYWEYNKDLDGSLTELENGYTPSYVVHPDTKIKNGLLFKYRLKGLVNTKVKIHLLAEKIFVADDNDVTKWHYKTVEQLIKQAINEFCELYESKYFEATGLHSSSIIHQVKPEEIQLVLNLLQ